MKEDYCSYKEDYCSYEVAKLLKDKGFNDPFIHMFINKDNVKFDCSSTGVVPKETIACPTHQMAMKWLMGKGIYICPKPCCFQGSKKKDIPYYLWEARIVRLPSNNIIYPQPLDMCKHYETYEEAVEAALKYSLNNLI